MLTQFQTAALEIAARLIAENGGTVSAHMVAAAMPRTPAGRVYPTGTVAAALRAAVESGDLSEPSRGTFAAAPTAEDMESTDFASATVDALTDCVDDSGTPYVSRQVRRALARKAHKAATRPGPHVSRLARSLSASAVPPLSLSDALAEIMDSDMGDASALEAFAPRGGAAAFRLLSEIAAEEAQAEAWDALTRSPAYLSGPDALRLVGASYGRGAAINAEAF